MQNGDMQSNFRKYLVFLNNQLVKQRNQNLTLSMQLSDMATRIKQYEQSELITLQARVEERKIIIACKRELLLIKGITRVPDLKPKFDELERKRVELEKRY